MRKPVMALAVMIAAFALAPSSAHAQAAGGGGGGGGGGGSGGLGVWILGGCVTGIFIAAIDAGRREKRELTAGEAITCGLLYWFDRRKEKKRPHGGRYAKLN